MGGNREGGPLALAPKHRRRPPHRCTAHGSPSTRPYEREDTMTLTITQTATEAERLKRAAEVETWEGDGRPDPAERARLAEGRARLAEGRA